MFKFVVVLAAVCACALATGGRIRVAWPCVTHTIVNSSLPDKYYDEYRMVADDKTLYTLEFVHKDGQVYFGAAAFDPFGDYSKADVYTNQSGECTFAAETPLYEIYDSYFDYTNDPEPVECPDNDEDCVKYCNEKRCIILSDYSRLLQDTNLETQEVLTYTYKYTSDASIFETVREKCPDAKFNFHNYCDGYNWVRFQPDCLHHVNVTSNVTDTKYYEEYRMNYYSRPIYSLKYVHTNDKVYYDLIYFEVTSYPEEWDVLSNKTGECQIYENEELYETFDSTFQYYFIPEDVDCPDGATGCKKYCGVLKCLILDAQNRTVQDINMETGEALTYTYLEDVPSVDIFSMECAGTQYKAIDVCANKSVHFDWGCALHINVTNNKTDNYHDEYRMYNGDKIAYAYHNVYSEGEYYYELNIFDPDAEEIFDYTTLTNMSGDGCEEWMSVGTDEIYEPEFVYYHDPETVDCPEGYTDCKRYCSFIKCVTVDKDNHLLKELEVGSGIELSYTYLDDVPTINQFSMECDGTQYTATNYCDLSSSQASSSSQPAPSSSQPAPSSSQPAPSSSQPAPSSSQPTPSSSHPAPPTPASSDASVTKAAFAVVLAALLAVLL